MLYFDKQIVDQISLIVLRECVIGTDEDISGRSNVKKNREIFLYFWKVKHEKKNREIFLRSNMGCTSLEKLPLFISFFNLHLLVLAFFDVNSPATHGRGRRAS